MLGVFFVLFVVAVLWAVTVTVFCFYRNPLPFPDRGHRCFAVPNEKAAKVAVDILGKIGSLPERFTFDTGSISHAVLMDNGTVIIWDEDQKLLNGLSIVCHSPKSSALEAMGMLKRAGFTAVIRDIMPEMGDHFAFIESDAFNGWILIFRRHILVLGKPPNQRKISR